MIFFSYLLEEGPRVESQLWWVFFVISPGSNYIKREIFHFHVRIYKWSFIEFHSSFFLEIYLYGYRYWVLQYFACTRPIFVPRFGFQYTVFVLWLIRIDELIPILVLQPNHWIIKIPLIKLLAFKVSIIPVTSYLMDRGKFYNSFAFAASHVSPDRVHELNSVVSG